MRRRSGPIEFYLYQLLILLGGSLSYLIDCYTGMPLHELAWSLEYALEVAGLGDKPCCSRSGCLVQDLDAGQNEGMAKSKRVKTLDGARPSLQCRVLSALPTWQLLS